MPEKSTPGMICPICEAGCELSEHNSGHCQIIKLRGEAFHSSRTFSGKTTLLPFPALSAVEFILP